MKVFLIASGKGGTGKTTIAAGVGTALAQRGKRVLVIDCDCYLRSLDLVLGMSDRVVYSFADVISNAVTLEQAAVCHPLYETLSLLTAPASQPLLTEHSMDRLRQAADALHFDYILLDGPAGLPEELCLLSYLADEALIITSTDLTCVRGAAACARRLYDEYAVTKQKIILNRVRPTLIASGRAPDIDDAMDEIGLPLIGLVPEDTHLIVCSNHGQSIFTHRQCQSARAFMRIARRLEGERVPLTSI